MSGCGAVYGEGVGHGTEGTDGAVDEVEVGTAAEGHCVGGAGEPVGLHGRAGDAAGVAEVKSALAAEGRADRRAGGESVGAVIARNASSIDEIEAGSACCGCVHV
jgi:hypothetical protein